jgi:hypothetical protein
VELAIVDGLSNVLGGLFQCLLDASVQLGLKEGFEDFLALRRACQQQLPELALGKHHDLSELLTPKSQQTFDLLINFAPLRRQNMAFFAIAGKARALPQRRAVVRLSCPDRACGLALAPGS